MFFLITIFLGWFLINLALSGIEFLFNIPNGFLKDPFWYYSFIGYVVMIICGIKSPFITNSTESPFTSVKRIEMKLFFKDVYYSMWWPYYIFKKISKK